jgi:endonuclease/exonuclease/phosphatase family metal-dependent hydrolase
MKTLHVSWWNLENLFDVNNCPDRPAWLQKQLNTELQGWDGAVLNKKLEQLAKVIKQMKNNEGPDILGVCEVENKNVLQLLTKKLDALPHSYDIAHADTADGRGIDVAFIYDKNKVKAKETFNHHVMKRTATRDLFQVNMETADGNEFILIGNHWPSRRGGEYQSEPYRMMVAEVLAYWHERIVEIKGEKTPVIIMGDFNDEPFNRSVREYALSWRFKDKVVNAVKPKFHNLMWDVLGEGKGTLHYNGQPNVLDQVWVSKAVYDDDAKIKLKTPVEMFTPAEMISGGYPDPIAFKRPSTKEYNPEGYSDHFPIWFEITED